MKKRLAGLIPAWKIGGAMLSLLLLAGLASCGGGNDDPNSVKLQVKPELGDLGNYVTITTKDAVISLSEFPDDGVPRVKISSTLQATVDKAVASDWGFDLKTVVLDENMNEITDFMDYDIESSYDYDRNEYSRYLKAGEIRAVMDEAGPKSQWDGKAQAIWDMIREKGKYIVVKPSSSHKFVPLTSDTKSSASEEDMSTVVDDVEATASGSEDWDKVLDEYESFCDKIVPLAKKAQAGDISAVAEYASLLQSAQSLQSKLDNAGSDLSAAQAARLSKISAKLASAAAAM